MVTFKKHLLKKSLGALLALSMLPSQSLGNVQTSRPKPTLETTVEQIVMKNSAKLALDYLRQSENETQEQKESLYAKARKALSESQKNVDYFKGMGKLNVLVGGHYGSKAIYEQAIPFLREAARLHEDEETLQLLVESERETGDFKAALSDAERWKNINPNSAKVYNELGFIQYTAGSMQKAISAWNTAVSLKPDYHQVFNNLGAAYEAIGDDWKAIEYTQKALEVNPDYPNAHFRLAQLLKKKGDTEKARNAFNEAVRLDPAYERASDLFK